MINWIRKIILIILSFLFTLIIIYILFIRLYSHELIILFKDKINLNSSFFINYSKIEIQAWRFFPNISIKVSKPSLALNNHPAGDILLNASNLYVNISLIDALQKKIIVNSLVLSDGTIKIDSTFYSMLFEQETTTNANNGLLLGLNNVSFRNIAVSYKSTPSPELLFYINSAKLSGVYSEGAGIFRIDATSDSISYNKKTFDVLENRINLRGNLQITDNNVQLKNSTIIINDLNIKATLDYTFLNDSLNIKLFAPKVLLAKQQKLLKQLTNLNIPKGVLSVDFLYITNMSLPEYNYIHTNYSLKDARVVLNKSTPYTIKELVGSLEFNSSLRNSKINISNFHLIRNSSSAKGIVKINNLEQPNVLIDCSFDLRDDLVHEHLDDFTANISGSLKTIVRFENMNGIKNYKILRLKSSFSIDRPRYKELTIINQIKTKVEIIDNNFNATISGLINNSRINGRVFVPSFLNVANKKTSLFSSVTLSVDSINLNDFIPLIPPLGKPTDAHKFLTSVNLKSNFSKVLYGVYQFDNVALVLNYNSNGFEIPIFEFDAFDGGFSGAAKIDKNRIVLSSIFDHADIKKLSSFLTSVFKQPDFSHNITGNLTGTVALSGNKDSILVNKYNTLSLQSILKIENGKIFNLKQFKKMSYFIKLQEVENIDFNTLTNTIYINNNQLTIPEMEIKSNLLNLKVSGNHNLNGDYSYCLNFKLADLLGRQYTSSNREKDYYTDETNKVNLFIKIVGNKDAFSVSYDSKKAFNNFKNNVFTDTKELKKTVLEDFFSRRDTVSFSSENIIDSLNNKTTISPFKIEWEELDTIKIK